MVTLVPCKQALRCNISTTLQECISKSAIQTKFESHAVSGLKVAQTVKVIMEQIVGCAFQQRLATFYLLGLFSCNNTVEPPLSGHLSRGNPLLSGR